MQLSVQVTLSTGATLEDTTSDFAAIDEAVATYQRVIGTPRSTLNWHSPDGRVHVLSGTHIVCFRIERADHAAAR